jgi:hypothetical protein
MPIVQLAAEDLLILIVTVRGGSTGVCRGQINNRVATAKQIKPSVRLSVASRGLPDGSTQPRETASNEHVQKFGDPRKTIFSRRVMRISPGSREVRPTTKACLAAIHRQVLSDQIRKILFCLAKPVKAEPEKACRHAKPERQAGQIERALAVENTPAEAVYDPDHRIEGIG